MRRFKLLLLFLPVLLSASDFNLQVRVGYFYPISSVMEDVYHSGGVIPEIEGSFDFGRKFRAWINFNVFLRDGYTALEDIPFLQLYELSGGFKRDFKIIDKLFFYLGIGPSFVWLLEKTNASSVPADLYGSSIGFVGKGGFIWNLPDNLILDLFADYSYNQMDGLRVSGTTPNNIDAGGIRAGLGLGRCF